MTVQKDRNIRRLGTLRENELIMVCSDPQGCGSILGILDVPGMWFGFNCPFCGRWCE